MRGWNRKISAIVGRILIIGFSVQIVLGMVWALIHVGYFQEFPEGHFLEKVSRTLVCDEYTGILYPFLIRILQGFQKVVPIPYFSVLYLLQLGMAAWADWYFLGAFERFQRASLWKKIWSVLTLVTLPMAMQCHMAVLPISLTTSLFLVQLGILERVFWRDRNIRQTEKKRVVRNLAWIGMTGLVMGLLMPEYRFFGGIPLLFYAIADIFQVKGTNPGLAGVKQVVWITLVAAVFLGMGGMLHSWFTQEGAYGRMQNTVEAAAFRRFAWDDFGEYYSEWPQELRDALTQEEIRTCNIYPLQKEWILGEKVDAVYGRERAREIYGQVQALTAKARFSRNLKEIMKDCLYYVAAPVTQLWLMEGHGQANLSGRNLDVMRAKNPEFTMLYIRYGHPWFAVALILTFCQGLLEFCGLAGGQRKKALQKTGWYVGICGVVILWYAMQGGGIMDYKNVLAVTTLWTGMFCHKALASSSDESD